jgi:hypothetical protein
MSVWSYWAGLHKKHAIQRVAVYMITMGYRNSEREIVNIGRLGIHTTVVGESAIHLELENKQSVVHCERQSALPRQL